MRVALLVALVLVPLTVLAGCGGDAQEVVVPYVAGLKEQLATDVAAETGLLVRIERERNDKTKKGFVYAQSPREGSEVEPDSELALWVSSGDR